MRGALKTYRNLPAGAAERQEQLTDMYSRVDVMARKGIIPRKRASRIKSRLASLAAR
ncbi:MAG: 30S ribosomal protein S20 [Candidatus Krumholzibacteria bacterium]|nr:30S ribosomal protein S20 [Candidatus Krumholzibacteria bacterium]